MVTLVDIIQNAVWNRLEGETKMNMQNVINFILEDKKINAIKTYREITSTSLPEAKNAVEALYPYLRSNSQLAPQMPKAEEKPQINKWVITAIAPDTDNDWHNSYISEIGAMEDARRLCNQGFTHIRVSRVIAEAQSTIIWTMP